MTELVCETGSTPGERRSEAEKLYDAAVLARVKRGIALLEREHGANWVEHVDLDVLDLSHGARCVLGQVFADEARESGDATGYDWAAEGVFWRAGESAASCGFFDDDGKYGDLQACWEDLLTPAVEAR